jgi:hypothetical protein
MAIETDQSTIDSGVLPLDAFSIEELSSGEKVIELIDEYIYGNGITGSKWFLGRPYKAGTLVYRELDGLIYVCLAATSEIEPDSTDPAVEGVTWHCVSGSTAIEYVYNTQATINTNDTTSFASGSGGTDILSNTARTYYDVQFETDIAETDDIFVAVHRKDTTSNWFKVRNAKYYDTGSYVGDADQGTAAGPTPYGVGIHSIVGETKKVRVYFEAQAWSRTNLNTSWATYKGTYDKWRVEKVAHGL